MADLAREAIGRWDRLDGDRAVSKTHWQDVADYILPDRNDYIVERVPGQKRMTKIYDSTPVFALDMFAAGMHSLLTSPTLQWFTLWAEDDRINTNRDAKAWLEDAGQVMYRIFNGARHNFASQSHELYLDQGSIGTSVMAVLESTRSGILFSTRHVKECVIGLNEEDRVDVLLRKWKWSARQAVAAWGEEALKRAGADKVLKNWVGEDVDTPRWDFIHAVEPRSERDPQRSERRNKAFRSLYVSVADGCTIDEGGFDEFPYLAPRFSKLTGESYGRGPGMLNLPDVKMLNEMVRTVLKSAQKIVDPPLMVPDSGFLVPLKTLPGSINFYRQTANGHGVEPVKTDGQVTLGVELLNGLRQQILRGFYVEWMLMPSDPSDPAGSGKGITATYVLQQRDEKMRLLSPMLARLQSEFLGPLIDRVFGLLWRKSARLRFGPGSPFRPPPQILSGVPLRPEYVSPIALAQKSSQMDAVTKLLELQMQLRNIDPQGQLIIDGEMMMRIAGRDWNAPAGALKSPELLQQEAQAKAEAEQAMQQHMALANLAGAAKDGTGALKNLSDVANANQQGGDQGQQQQEAA